MPLEPTVEFGEPPARSGIYVAQPTRAEMVPVTRDRRYVDTCARVNNLNVKIGKAKNLALRKLNYQKDFDVENILFIPIIATDDFGRAETVILKRLKEYRKRSPKGRRMDWLEGISIEDAIRTVFDSLNKEGIPYFPLAGFSK